MNLSKEFFSQGFCSDKYFFSVRHIITTDTYHIYAAIFTGLCNYILCCNVPLDINNDDELIDYLLKTKDWY